MPSKTERQGRIFSFDVDVALATNETFQIVPEEQNATARKYLPFDGITVWNDSDENIKVYVNDGAVAFKVGSKADKAYNKIKIRNVKIENPSAASTSADEITIEFQSNETDSTKLSERIAASPIFNVMFPMRE